MLIYGGVTSVYINRTINLQTYAYSNQAYIWQNESWSTVHTTNPCSNQGQDLAFQQPCTSRIVSNQTQVVVITFGKQTPCTSLLNLNTYEWSMVNGTRKSIPIGGHLVTSLDKKRVFYLGGIYYKPEESQSLNVFELDFNGWQLTKTKLPFGISSNETSSFPSLHNVTLNSN